MRLNDACREAGVSNATVWHMVQFGLLDTRRYAQRQYRPSEIAAALPEYKWLRKYGGDSSPLLRECIHCGEVKRSGEYRQYKNKSSKYGYLFRGQCRACERAAKNRPDPSSHREYQRQWRNRPEVRARLRQQLRERRSSPKAQIDHRMSKQIRRCLSGGSWRNHLPYTIDELKLHLERQFLTGMGWENMHLWHIDHITPKSSFTYESAEDAEFLACWGLANLRPLWAADNISKGARRQVLL